MKIKWTQQEIDFIIKYYNQKGPKFTATQLKRTITSVMAKAKHLKIIVQTKRRWNESETLFLKENYTTYGPLYISEKLNRTLPGVKHRAKLLNLETYNKKPKISKIDLEKLVKLSYCFSDLIKKLEHKISTVTINKYILEYNINISHFDPYKLQRARAGSIIIAKPLVECLLNGTNIQSNDLKKRLYKEGLKLRICELCGQGEEWQGKHMSLILDHKNGINNDNRIENLRIVCPNCNATLDTHCGKNIKYDNKNHCIDCNKEIKRKQKRCKDCNKKACVLKPRPNKRKVERPPFSQLKQEIDEFGYSATGRKYNVSDNAIRHWERMYEKYGDPSEVIAT
jgi:hypothetical protein